MCAWPQQSMTIAESMIKEQIRKLGWAVRWMLGWEEHAPNRGRLGTAAILGEL
ncbi:MAG: hypothetical protein Nkreftii_000756 [Candidatus Nitrospira kreftii]|uniref:Uncharacterized protein n=1 Tax=Candidatus Nitrospira kreftii TaxID=2652173 RepID=A0A7S8FBW6_9BACT|nr:MAG: hypothetical protein Nkreftii_000756 [Candidatus Nitrospira kreftii]